MRALLLWCVRWELLAGLLQQQRLHKMLPDVRQVWVLLLHQHEQQTAEALLLMLLGSLLLVVS